MKKKKKKIRWLLLIIIIIYIIFQNDTFNIFSEYKTIKQDKNKNYAGIGQQKVKNQDGYFTTFTTIDDHKKTYIEYKQNNASWSNNSYWGGTMEENGCGITALAIILSGYNKTHSPEDLRQKYYPVLKYDFLSKELSDTYNIENSDFYYNNTYFTQEKLQEHLKTNRPVLICVWSKHYSNRWTSASHYMVLLAADDNNMVYVSNPNGGENDFKSSGWYNFQEIIPYIAKVLYIESYN